MLLDINYNDKRISKEVENTENSIWKAIGEELLNVDSFPTIMTVCCESGNATLNISKRGTYKENGIEKPSMFVKNVVNDINVPPSYNYKEAYLTCIHPESNNYKFYHLIPKSNENEVDVIYGRIGVNDRPGSERRINIPYESYLYWIRYYEKLSKGYIDQSDIYLGEEQTVSKEKDEVKTNDDATTDTASTELFALLKQLTVEKVKNTFCYRVTPKQVEKSKELVQKLYQCSDVKSFNEVLLKLMTISPRHITYVEGELADKFLSSFTFKNIITREEDLIDAMAGSLLAPKDTTNKTKFDQFGTEVYIATEKQKEQVMSRLSDRLKPKVKQVYRVINHEQKCNFDNYVAEHNIQNIKQLWHGSRNCNWLSIIVNGLLLKPNAQITGKMFGDGIYFAPSSMKSWNYTSFQGTYWAKGQSDIAIMGLYATAYGNPCNPTSASKYTQSELNSKGYDCVHAKAGTFLRNDEIVYYDEHAMLLQYIVEFSN